MNYVDFAQYRTEAWIFVYIKKYNEDERNVRYRYFIDTDEKDKAGAIEISKDIQFLMSDYPYKKMKMIEDCFEKGMIKIIKTPKNIVDKTERIEDYNAVYVAKTIIESHYWKGIYEDHFLRVVAHRFENYIKKCNDFLNIINDKNNDLGLIQYKKEFVKDEWLFIKVKKIYEDDLTLKYKFYVDTADVDDYIIMKFSKKIEIKFFRKYIYLYERLVNKGLLKVDKNIDRQTADDIIDNRRSVIAIKYILDHYKKNNDYILQAVIINKEVYDYYNEVTQAINCLEFKGNDDIH